MSAKTSLFVCTTMIGSLGWILGCSHGSQARPTALAGEAPSITVHAGEEGRYNLHGLQAREEPSGTVVTGHVGPAMREPHRPDGHVDVQVVGPDGKVVVDGSSRLEPVNASPRVPVERQFRVEVPGDVPPGSEIKVHYHGTPDLCHP